MYTFPQSGYAGSQRRVYTLLRDRDGSCEHLRPYCADCDFVLFCPSFIICLCVVPRLVSACFCLRVAHSKPRMLPKTGPSCFKNQANVLKVTFWAGLVHNVAPRELPREHEVSFC